MSKRLNLERRKLIEEHLASQWSLRRIASALCVSGSSVSREGSRNGGAADHRAAVAQERAALMRVGWSATRVRGGLGGGAGEVGLALEPGAGGGRGGSGLVHQRAHHSPPDQGGWGADARKPAAARQALLVPRRATSAIAQLHSEPRPFLPASAASRRPQRAQTLGNQHHLGPRQPSPRQRAHLGGSRHPSDCPVPLAACQHPRLRRMRPAPPAHHPLRLRRQRRRVRAARITQAIGAPMFFTDPRSPQQHRTRENAVALMRDIAENINNRPMKTHHWKSRNQAAKRL